MPSKIIDTNVPLTAAGMNVAATTDCQRDCLEVVRNVLSGKYTVVIDDGTEVLTEYRRNMHPDVMGSPAGQFMIHVLTNQFSPKHVHQVRQERDAKGQILDYPDNEGNWTTEVPRCERFDPDDKKWVALAQCFKKEIGTDVPIVNAADRCWLAFEPHLESAGVTLEVLCRDER